MRSVETKGIKGLVIRPSQTTTRRKGPSKQYGPPVLAVEHVTPFRSKVYSALCEIPEGKVVTYGVLAAHIGSKSAQAVGQALKANPYAPTVPCHRVVSSDLSIGGFQGAREGSKISKKIQLLTREGVKFDDNGRVNAASVYLFS